MKIILAVGNPGKEYAGTRHNIGWLAADRIAEAWGAVFSRRAFQARVASAERGGKVLLAKPQTFVNRVGGSARAILDYYHAPAQEMLVLVDDVHLPFGELRLRRSGSAGGHNGLKSIIEAAGEEFPRLRMGVGEPSPGRDLVDHVLGPFTREERRRLEEVLAAAQAAAEAWLDRGIEAAMNEFN
jgi:PTH1 family peptidyl-tRNA hydrolase